jgi:acyl-CoA reductase-like NAD-dependent aldehyde dehydrogenase
MDNAAWDDVDGRKAYKLFIDGEWVVSTRNEMAEDINPATGEVFAYVQQAGDEEVERAIAAAHAASGPWGESLVAERETLLLRVGDIVKARTDEIRALLIEECGSAYSKAQWEID